MMGKKKVVKKTKEVSVAIAESSVGTEIHTPRKRGRPRKVVDKETAQDLQEFEGTGSKRPKSGKEEEEDEEEEVEDKVDKEKRLEEIKEVVGSPSKSSKEDDEEEKESSPKKQQRKSRARKKGKPRKSS